MNILTVYWRDTQSITGVNKRYNFPCFTCLLVGEMIEDLHRHIYRSDEKRKLLIAMSGINNFTHTSNGDMTRGLI